MGGSLSTLESKWFPAFVENDMPTSLAEKTVAVTGTTTGIGYIYARTTIEKGAKNVLLLNRPSDRAEKSEKELKEHIVEGSNTNVEMIPCDLQDFESVQKAANLIKSKYDSVDILCNNAGIMAVEDKATKDGYDVQMQTNHLSHFLLTKELFPLLKRAQELRGDARIVNHSSAARNIGNMPLDAKYLGKNGGNLGGNTSGWNPSSGPKWIRYQQTKLANSVFTLTLADRLKDTGIKATVAAPGYSVTSLQTSSTGMSGMLWTRNFMAQTAEDGTMPLLAASFLPCENGAFWHPSGRGNLTGPAVNEELDELSKDPKSGKMLWEASEEACGKFEIQ